MRNVGAGSPFAVAQSIGMGGPVPWYGYILGGVILALFVLTIYGLGLGVTYCFSRRAKRKYVFSIFIPHVILPEYPSSDSWTPLKDHKHMEA
jgi:hypothetical protein